MADRSRTARLLGVVTTASEPDALAFNDWIPIDAASHATRERILETRLTAGVAAHTANHRAGPGPGGGTQRGGRR